MSEQKMNRAFFLVKVFVRGWEPLLFAFEKLGNKLP